MRHHPVHRFVSTSIRPVFVSATLAFRSGQRFIGSLGYTRQNVELSFGSSGAAGPKDPPYI
jgi:hypothetical protein